MANTVSVIAPNGDIDTTATIGKDAELMVDMRQQLSITNGNNFNVNGDLFSFPFPPIFLIPSFLGLAQREENLYRSVATTKVIQRYGILDSVVHSENGSIVSTKNILFDSETGDVVLTRTQNEFNDPIYNFSYPTHWAYGALGEAYKNINVVFDHVYMKDGKITSGLPMGISDTAIFVGGDELLIASHQKTGGSQCADSIATFPDYSRLWVVDTSVVHGGRKNINFVDVNGQPFTGNDISLKIVRSGRKNINGSVASVTTLANPLVKSGQKYQVTFNTSSKTLNASASEFRALWEASSSTSCPVCPEGSKNIMGLAW